MRLILKFLVIILFLSPIVVHKASAQGGPSFQISTPSGGEVFQLGDTFEAKWQTIGNTPRVNLTVMGYKKNPIDRSSLGLDDTCFWYPLADNINNTGSYTKKLNYKAKNYFSKDGCEYYELIVSDVEGGSIKGHSALFKITSAKDKTKSNVAPSITVLSPNGGERFKEGDTMQVKWKTTGNIQNVVIAWQGYTEPVPSNIPYYQRNQDELDKNVCANGFYKDEVKNKGKFSLKLKNIRADNNNLKSCKYFEVAIFDSANWNIIDTSDSVFSIDLKNQGKKSSNKSNKTVGEQKCYSYSDSGKTIEKKCVVNPGRIKITSPTAYQDFQVGDVLPIRWKTGGKASKVKLYIMGNNIITSSENPRISCNVYGITIGDVPNTGSYDWVIDEGIFDSLDFQNYTICPKYFVQVSTEDEIFESEWKKQDNISGLFSISGNYKETGPSVMYVGDGGYDGETIVYTGDPVKIEGSGFLPKNAVIFRNQETDLPFVVPNVSSQNSNIILMAVPKDLRPGKYYVWVANADGRSGSAPGVTVKKGKSGTSR